MRFFVLLSLLFFAFGANAQTWDLNEVSVLMPLPRSGEENRMLLPIREARGGVLLPYEAYASLPTLVVGVSQEAIYRTLRVVAVRLDPCFQEGPSPVGCERQVRLIWQPLSSGQGLLEMQGIQTHDAAAHTFHRLSEADWQKLLQDMEALRRRFPLGPGLPLQVHPILRSQGYHGEYWAAWSKAILAVVGPENLRRITAMTVNPLGTVWVFAGFEISQGQMQRLRIPRINHGAQGFFANLEDTSELRTQMNPKVPGQELYDRLIVDSRLAKQEMNPSQLVEAVRIAVESENPLRHNPGTMDCATCHASRAVTHWARKNFPQWDWGRMFRQEQFVGPGNALNTSVNPLRSDVLRAFGYFGLDPIISGRTINESQMSVQQIQRERFFR